MSTSVTVITGAIAIAGDGAPSHETTAAIASNPGRRRTNSVPSSGIGMSGSTSCVRAMVLTSPPCVAVSQSGGSTWPCNAQKNTDAPTSPVISAGTGSHQGGPMSSPTSVRRQRNAAATATTTMSGSTVSGSNGMCTSCIAMPATPMNPADRPGDIASRCPPVPARTEQRRQREAWKQGGDHHPGKRLREVLQ